MTASLVSFYVAQDRDTRWPVPSVQLVRTEPRDAKTKTCKGMPSDFAPHSTI